MKIQIPKLVYDKVMHWVNKTDIEVSGFGTVKYDSSTDSFNIINAYLLKQEGGAAHTDIDAVALGKLAYDTRNDDGDLRWWWHSHVNMPVFWSSTDTDTIKDLGKHGWAVATVFNKKNEYKSAICYTSKAEFNELVHHDPDIATSITIPQVSDEVIARWDLEFTQNVTEKKFTPYVHQTYLTQEDREDAYTYGGYNEGQWTNRWKEKAPEEKPKEKTDYQKQQEINDWDPGLMGYGTRAEAKALNMKHKDYVALLDSRARGVDIFNIEQRLITAEIQGRLK